MSDFTKSRKSKHDNFRTPEEFYNKLNEEFHFNDDPCPIGGTGGLERDWGTSTFVNPPYSNPTPWCKKAYEESKNGKLVIMLLRGDTSTKWFHDWVLGKSTLRFIKGRLKFSQGPAPFPSIVAIYKPKQRRHVSAEDKTFKRK